MDKKLSKSLWFNILLFNFMGAVAWNVENMYFNTFMYNSIYTGASAEAVAGTMSPTTAINLMVSLSAFTAVVTTFIMGTLSDKLKKRKIFITVGYICWGIVTAMFGFISRDTVGEIFGLNSAAQILTFTVWTVIIMDMLMTFMGSTSNDSAFNAWVTDVTTPKIRQKVEAVLMFNVFIAMAVVMSIGSFAQSGAISYKSFFLVLGITVTICGIIGLFTLKDSDAKKISSSDANYWSDLFYGFRPSVIKENSRLYLALISICLFLSAFQVFFPYLFVYLQYVILPANAGVNLLSAKIIITAVAAVLGMVIGVVVLLKIANKNKVWCFVPAVILMSAGLFILSRSTSIMGVLIGVGPTVIGYLVLTVQLNAAIKNFIPLGKAGRFQGIRMIFVVLIPMIIGPILGNIASLNSAVKYVINEYVVEGNLIQVEEIIPSSSMFLYSSILALLVLVPLGLLIKKGFEVEDK